MVFINKGSFGMTNEQLILFKDICENLSDRSSLTKEDALPSII